MATRGLRVIRYRRRYYAIYNHQDSHPEGLGKDITRRIPKDPQSFAAYLDKLCEYMKKCEADVMKYLCRRRADYIEEDSEDAAQLVLIEAQDEGGNQDLDCRCVAWFPGTSLEDGKENPRPWESLPSFMPSCRDIFTEWIYTTDYDNQVFTVNNSAHLRLSRIPGEDWIDALTVGLYGDNVFVSELLPPGTVSGIGASLPAPERDLLQLHNRLHIRFVKARGIAGFPPTQRHGPIFRACIYNYLPHYICEPLSAALLSWKPEDLPFREIAFAILSLASARHTALVQYDELVEDDRAGFCDLLRSDSYSERAQAKPEFLTHLWTGSHLQGNQPGSAPAKTTYWFEGALVHLVSRLEQPDVVRAGIAVVQQRCLAERPGRSSNALLLSVEHVVFLRIYSDGTRVDRTEVQTLFDIVPHRSLDPYERYDNKSICSQLQARTADLEQYGESCAYLQNPRLGIYIGEPTTEKLAEAEAALDWSKWEAFDKEHRHPDGDFEQATTTFYHLVHFIEVSAREEFPLRRAAEGVFPREIYELVLRNIDSLETHRACMQVSRVFRDLCLKHCVLYDGMMMKPSLWTKTYEREDESQEDRDEGDNEEGGEEEEEGADKHVEFQKGKEGEQNGVEEDEEREEPEEPVEADEVDEPDESKEDTFEMEWRARTPTHHKGMPVATRNSDGSIIGAVTEGSGLMRLNKMSGESPTYDPLQSLFQVALGNEKHRRTLLPWLILTLLPARTSR